MAPSRFETPSTKCFSKNVDDVKKKEVQKVKLRKTFCVGKLVGHSLSAETNSAMVPFSSRGPHGVNDMPHHRIQFSQTATSAVIFGSWCAFQ